MRKYWNVFLNGFCHFFYVSAGLFCKKNQLVLLFEIVEHVQQKGSELYVEFDLLLTNQFDKTSRVVLNHLILFADSLHKGIFKFKNNRLFILLLYLLLYVLNRIPDWHGAIVFAHIFRLQFLKLCACDTRLVELVTNLEFVLILSFFDAICQEILVIGFRKDRI